MCLRGAWLIRMLWKHLLSEDGKAVVWIGETWEMTGTISGEADGLRSFVHSDTTMAQTGLHLLGWEEAEMPVALWEVSGRYLIMDFPFQKTNRLCFVKRSTGYCQPSGGSVQYGIALVLAYWQSWFASARWSVAVASCLAILSMGISLELVCRNPQAWSPHRCLYNTSSKV